MLAFSAARAGSTILRHAIYSAGLRGSYCSRMQVISFASQGLYGQAGSLETNLNTIGTFGSQSDCQSCLCALLWLFRDHYFQQLALFTLFTSKAKHCRALHRERERQSELVTQREARWIHHADRCGHEREHAARIAEQHRSRPCKQSGGASQRRSAGAFAVL